MTELAPWSQTSSLQNHERINFCCLRHPIYGILLSQPEWRQWPTCADSLEHDGSQPQGQKTTHLTPAVEPRETQTTWNQISARSLPAVWCWAGYLTSLCLNFLVYKTGAHDVAVEIKRVNEYSALRAGHSTNTYPMPTLCQTLRDLADKTKIFLPPWSRGNGW